MSLALSVCVLFILLMQAINEVQFLNTTSLWTLFELSLACAATVIFLLTSKYASLLSHKIDFIVEVSVLIWLLVLYVPRA